MINNQEYKELKAKALKIKRSISNNIWNVGNEHIDEFLDILSDSEYIGAIELNLSRIFKQAANFNQQELINLKNKIQQKNLEISGLTDIFTDFEQTKSTLLKSEDIFHNALKRIKEYINFALMLKTKNISLNNMNFVIRGEISKPKADEIFLSFLEQIEKYILENKLDIKIHILPSVKEKRDYLNNYVEVVSLLEKKRFEHIQILVHLKTVFDTFSNDIKYFKDKSRYFSHFSVSDLKAIPPSFDDISLHNKIVNLSHYMKYKNDFFALDVDSIELFEYYKNQKEGENPHTKENLLHFIHVFKEIYVVPIPLSPFCSELFPNLVYRHLSPEGVDKEHLIKPKKIT
jgi:hypothetical protein